VSVRVLFFASLRDAVGVEELSVPLSGPVTVQGLLAVLAGTLEREALDALGAENVRLAINQELAAPAALVRPGDEVAFMPPVTGG
jgi:molybdopterin converting factor subunit 1